MCSQNTKSQKNVTIKEWKESCKVQHKFFCSQLGDRIWDQFDYPSHDKQILQKIAIPLFGKPIKENFDLDLTDEQKKFVHEIRNKCVAHSVNGSQIRMSIIFVSVYVNNTIQTVLPIVRVMSHAGETLKNIPDNIFIDHLGRVYDNWTKYKENNTLNESWLYVPANGYYGSQNNYEFLDQSKRGQLLKSFDEFSTITNMTTTTTLLGAIALGFFPPTALFGAALALSSAIYGAPGAVYGVGRSIEKIVDRFNHEQSISLADSEARQCWLMSATSLLSVGSMVAGKILTKGAQSGLTFSSFTRKATTTLFITSSTTAGLGIINSIYEFSKKDDKTIGDILQLSTSIFFFSHSLLTLKTASHLISDAQKVKIASIRNNLSSEQQLVHDALLKGTKEVIEPGKIREMHGRAQFIREMKSIQNFEEFYSHFGINTDGQFSINSKTTIHPKAFLQMSEADRFSLMELSRDLKNNKIDLNYFNKTMAPIEKLYRLKLDCERTVATNYLKTAFAVEELSDIPIVGLDMLEPEKIDRLEQVVRNSYHNADGELMTLVAKFAQAQGASNLTEYCATGEYAVRKVEAEIAMKRNDDPTPKMPPDVKVKNFYKSQVVQEYLTDVKKFKELNDDFKNLRVEVDAVNTGHPRFNNSMAAANHYDKHPFFPMVDPQNNLSVEKYFHIATEMAGGPIADIKWTQDGSALKCTFTSDKYGATAITYENLANRTSVIATLMATGVNEIRLVNPRVNN